MQAFCMLSLRERGVHTLTAFELITIHLEKKGEGGAAELAPPSRQPAHAV